MHTATKLLFPSLILAVVFFTLPPAAGAETIDHCQRRIVHAEHDLHRAIVRYGRNSRRAAHERLELHNARERCWRERQQWWDEHGHQWRKAHDWDDHDHDHD